MAKQHTILCLMLLLPQFALAGLSHDLEQFFNASGFSSNVTAPRAYHGQQAGYYSGGSLVARTPVRELSLAHMDLPNARAGCGGIDLFTGGFSFINADSLIQAFKNILNNAKGYAFNLALETVTPQMANVMKYMQDMANKVNQSNINSCENASALVGGLWPKTHLAQKQVCETIGTHPGIGLFDDWAAARQGCGAEGKMAEVLAKGQQDPRLRTLMIQGNLLWRALANTTWDNELREVLMSLSGTLILHTGDKPSYQWLPPLVHQGNWLHALLYGGQLRRYHCHDSHCEHPAIRPLTIAPQAALVNKVRGQLMTLTTKIQADVALSEAEQSFLQATHLPIYKLLNLEVAYGPGKNPLALERYAELIALDIVEQYLQHSLRTVELAAQHIGYADALLKPFYRGIQQARTYLNQLPLNPYQRWQMAASLKEEALVLERGLHNTVSSTLIPRTMP